jgi:hypothetical protein
VSISAKIALGLFLPVCAIGGLIFWASDPFNLRSPYDETLLTVFHDHRQSFEKLRQMATEDSRQESRFTETDLGAELGEIRQREYKDEISQIFSGLIVVTDSYNAVRFIFASGGLSAISGGWLKGIEYLPEGKQNQLDILTSLDKARSLSPGVYFRRIESTWFIVYQKAD